MSGLWSAASAQHWSSDKLQFPLLELVRAKKDPRKGRHDGHKVLRGRHVDFGVSCGSARPRQAGGIIQSPSALLLVSRD